MPRASTSSSTPTSASRHASRRRGHAAAQPRALPIRLQPGRDHRAVAARQRRRLVAARSHRLRAGRGSRAGQGQGRGTGLRRRTLDAAGRHRGGCAGHRAERVALPAFHLAGRGRVRLQDPAGDAPQVRRALGDGGPRNGPPNPPLAREAPAEPWPRSVARAIGRPDIALRIPHSLARPRRSRGPLGRARDWEAGHRAQTPPLAREARAEPGPRSVTPPRGKLSAGVRGGR